MEKSFSLSDYFHFGCNLAIHDNCLVSMMHDIPVVPEERNVIMDDQLIEALSCWDNLSIVILCPFIFKTNYLPILINPTNVKLILYLKSISLLLH